MQRMPILAAAALAVIGLFISQRADAHDKPKSEVATPAVTSYTTFKAQGATGTAAVNGVSMTSAARNTIYHCRFTSATSGLG